MRPHLFLHQLAVRFSEMDESEARDLHAEAQKDYNERLDIAKSKQFSNMERLKEIAARSRDPKAPEPRKEEKLTMQDKLILKCEHYITRYGFALAYIVVVPLIRGYMNGESEEATEGDEDMDFLKLYSAFKKMKKS